MTIYAPKMERSLGAQHWTTDGANTPSVPYGGSNYTTLFYNSCGYAAMVGRLYITVDISQQHQGTYDFTLSRYGGGVSNRSSGSMNNYIQLDTPMIGNNEVLRWTNTNSNSWGNGSLRVHAIIWRGGDTSCFQTGYPGLEDNYNDTSSGNFFHRVG